MVVVLVVLNGFLKVRRPSCHLERKILDTEKKEKKQTKKTTFYKTYLQRLLRTHTVADVHGARSVIS